MSKSKLTYISAPGCKNLKMLPVLMTRPLRKKEAENIISEVAKFYGFDATDMIRKDRRKDIVQARQVAIYFITEKVNGITLKEIAALLSPAVKDHTTVIHSREKVLNQLTINDSRCSIRADVSTLRNII